MLLKGCLHTHTTCSYGKLTPHILFSRKSSSYQNTLFPRKQVHIKKNIKEDYTK